MTDTDPAFEPRQKTRAETRREDLLEAMLPEAAFDGWNETSLKRAADAAGVSEGEVELYCPDGVLDLIETWLADFAAQRRRLLCEVTA